MHEMKAYQAERREWSCQRGLCDAYPVLLSFCPPVSASGLECADRRRRKVGNSRDSKFRSNQALAQVGPSGSRQ
jgi:hypothetical protein